MGILTLCFSLAVRMASSKSAVIERLSDRYEILQPIGDPVGYQQLLANDMQQQRPVVIKSLTVEENTSAEDISCFEREIELLKSLHHPTIPRCLESFTVTTPSGKGLVLVQAHTGGQTLAQLLSTGQPYLEAEIKAIAKQLLQSLVYLHSSGLLHRDIRPDNIILASRAAESRVSWLNLGTVQYVQVQRPDTLVGTYGYMPPEQVGGQATFASDLYSLGATLIYLATGCHLGELPGNGLKAQFACAPTRLSPNFQRWLNWLIKPAVGDRPSSAQQALAALNRLPLAMAKQRFKQRWQPARAQTRPVPITPSAQTRSQPFFTQIKAAKKSRSLELIVPPVGLRSAHCKRALLPLLMGGALLGLAIYLITLLNFSPAMSSARDMAALAAACLAGVGCLYSLRFLKSGLALLNRHLFRQVYIQLEADVLLIAYKYWLRSPVYIVNTRREDIYSISALPNGEALRILTHRNRTQDRCGCYKLAVSDGALSHRDIRWLTSLLNDWRHQPGSCPNR